MSTHAYIAIQNDNGSVDCIYCHHDGYVKKGVGERLRLYYMDPEKVRNLIDLGNIGDLGVDLQNGTKAYHRDGKEPLKIEHYNNLMEFIDEAIKVSEYAYIYCFKKLRTVEGWKWDCLTPKHNQKILMPLSQMLGHEYTGSFKDKSWYTPEELKQWEYDKQESELMSGMHEETFKTKTGERNYPVIDYLPEGWKRDEGALTAPLGYAWVTNGKALFGKDNTGRLSAIIKEDILREMEEKQMSENSVEKEKKDISIKISKKLVGEPFVPKKFEETGREFVQISIPNKDPEDKSPWKTFVLPANQVHEDEKGSGKCVFFYLPAKGTTKVSKSIKTDEIDESTGKNIYKQEVKQYQNTKIKELCESYKQKEQEPRESVIDNLKKIDKEIKDQAAEAKNAEKDGRDFMNIPDPVSDDGLPFK